MQRLLKIVTLALILGPLATVQADVNPKVGGDEHTHTATATGKITTYRVQHQGVEFGSMEDRLDAEVIVTLDSEPGKIFGIRYHEGASPATNAMVSLLEEAFFHDQKVSLFHVQPPGRKNLSIIWVEVQR